MNLISKCNEEDKILCIIVDTQEEKYLYPVYDADDKERLNVIDSIYGIGRFYGWKDIETGKIYKKREEAYPKPQTPYELFGKECGPGWDKIIEPLINYIDEYNKSASVPIEITQIKEKFGGLRFYTDNEPEDFRELVKTAEEESYKTCEICGTKENVGHTLGWIQTICKDCLYTQVNDSHCTISEKKWRPIGSEEIFVFKKGDIILKQKAENLYNEK